MTRALVFAALTLASCASVPRRPIGYDDKVVDTEASPQTKKHEHVPDDVVARAEGPVRIVRLPDKVELKEPELIAQLFAADAVCVGEQHTTAAHHYAEVWLFDRSAVYARNAGLELGVGLEMFQQPYQSVVSAYQRGDIDESDLLRRTDYEKRWGYPFAYYRPLLERARRWRLPLVALNARYELTRAVAEDGIDSLNSAKRYELPKLNLDDREHRADFEARMKGHPGLTPDKLDHYYQAQVVWDEAMAERTANWLGTHAPVRRMLIVAGLAHCQRTAIPARTARRGGFRVKNVLLATKESDLNTKGYDYALLVGQR